MRFLARLLLLLVTKLQPIVTRFVFRLACYVSSDGGAAESKVIPPAQKVVFDPTGQSVHLVPVTFEMNELLYGECTRYAKLRGKTLKQLIMWSLGVAHTLAQEDESGAKIYVHGSKGLQRVVIKPLCDFG